MGIVFGRELSVRSTPIPGLSLIDLPVNGDARGWFKENWQREKMVAAGLEDFGPVQNNVSFNDAVGTTRGIHAEPWDKYISVASGRIFGAWVDLREGPTFGAVFTSEVDPSQAIFVPRGVGNAFQTLEPNTVYTYLVNDHWSPNAEYAFLNLADPKISIEWPIPLTEATLSGKDEQHPFFSDVVPIPPKKILVLGASGQLGTALRHELGEDDLKVEYATRDTLDLSSPKFASARRWRDYATIINAAAYTNVDRAETDEGRTTAWNVNVAGVAALARVAIEHGITVVHVSSDYVFDGSAPIPYTESAKVSPLSVYGQTKAAGDDIVSTVPRHYIVRTSWVVGEGPNFVRTMAHLAESGVDPAVVNDQTGRLTFTGDLAASIHHLLKIRAPYGLYNVTGGGKPMTWYDIARDVFTAVGHDPDRVRGTSTEEYFAASGRAVAPRPRNSVLDTTKATSLGVKIPPLSTQRLRDLLHSPAARV